MRVAIRRATLMVVLAVMIAGFTVPSSAVAQPGNRGPQSGDAALEKAPLPVDEFEKKALEVLAEINANEKYLNVPENDGRMLRIMVQSMGVKHAVELGTSTGISGIWIGLGLKDHGGKLTTYEIDPGRVATARKNFEAAGLSDVITVVEGDAHQEVTKLSGTIDFIFLDADKEGYIDYLNKLMPLLRPGGVVVAHNINPRMAHPPFMKAITEDPNLETVVRGGMSISLKKK
ncbi:O-methyltransferase [Aeoliella mucimassa]|uniref:O-methyltransferase/MSMEI_4947 n=1 Tax=Aeoliella mucimassa TaxID=2527972 RepID=A0A518APV2_9BACT|nr:O-methyltransferase [Aeoliella mucimassa]QDU56759.1 Putative O-methyltransferase/MSMEI_4947 [Aeoliella mucimassa]